MIDERIVKKIWSSQTNTSFGIFEFGKITRLTLSVVESPFDFTMDFDLLSVTFLLSSCFLGLFFFCISYANLHPICPHILRFPQQASITGRDCWLLPFWTLSVLCGPAIIAHTRACPTFPTVARLNWLQNIRMRNNNVIFVTTEKKCSNCCAVQHKDWRTLRLDTVAAC